MTMEAERKKKLMETYKNREVIGGIYCIRCAGNNRTWIRSTTDIESLRNRFNFALAIKSCPEPSMRSEWSEYGAESFSFTVLEALKKGEEQSSREFSDDIKVLYEIWIEKSKQPEQ